MSKRNILLAIGILVIVVGGAYALRDKDVPSSNLSPTPPEGFQLATDFDVGGAIQSIDSKSIVINDRELGRLVLYLYSETKYYDEKSQEIDHSSFKVGQWITARVTRNNSGEITVGWVMKWYAPGTAPDWVRNQ